MFERREPPFLLIYGVIILPLLALQIGIGLILDPSIIGGVTTIVTLMIIFAPMIVAEFITLNAKTASRTERRIVIASPLSPAATFEKLGRADLGRCKVIDRDAARGVLVLRSPIVGMSLGFLHPVFITAEGTGSAIEVGVKRRGLQHESTTSKYHQACAAKIETALAA